MTDKLLAAHQKRIPPSRRTEGHRPEQSQQPDRAIFFTPFQSPGQSRDDVLETLHEPMSPCTPHEAGLSAQLSRLSSRRLSASASSHAQPIPDPSDQRVAAKLAAAGADAPATDRQDLVRQFGKRKAKRILQGKLAVEDGQIYDLSLLKAIYEVYRRDTLVGGILFMLGCELPLVWNLVSC